MSLLLAFTIGVLYSAGFFLLLRRSLVKLIVGLVVLGHAANLLIFAAGRLVIAQPPFSGKQLPPLEEVADPLPQALVLTAIVIGFGVQAFAIILIKQGWRATGTGDVEKMRTTERLED